MTSICKFFVNFELIQQYNLFQPNVIFHIETSDLISTVNQMTDFHETQNWAELG